MQARLLGATTGFAALLALSPTLAGPAAAQELPCDTAQLIVPWSPGGGTDVIFRTVAQSINNSGASPQIQVVNIPGQGGNQGAKEARQARADGCTLFAVHQSAITSYFTGRVDFTWEAFEPVALLTRTPPIFGAHPDVPYDDVEGLVAEAKESPGEVLVGATLGSTSHFWYLLLQDKADVEFKYVSYDGTRERMTALLANTIQNGEINLAAAKEYIASGELKGLGIATATRNPQIPDVPTLKEQGIDLVGGTDRGVLAPEGTPDPAIEHWVDVFGKAMKDPKVVESLAGKGTQIQFVPDQEYRQYMEETFAEWQRIAKEVGVYQREEG